MKDFPVPDYLVPISALAGALKVLSAPVLKSNEDGSPQTSDCFPGCLAHLVRVEMVHIQRVESRPDGTTPWVRKTQVIPVTVWSESALAGITEGDYAILNGLMIGTDGGTLIYEALGISCANGLVEMLDQVE